MSKSQFNTQFGRKVLVDLTIKDIGATDANKQIVKLPQGAVLTSLILLTAVAFNSETSATATIKDGTTTFANAVDVKTTGSETITGTPKFYPAGGTLEFTLAETGAAATQGRAFAVVEYVVVGGTDEIYG